MEETPQSSLRVNGDRLLRRLDELGALGAIHGANGEPGSARLALSDEDRLGRDLVTAWMHDLGMNIRIDAIGNVVAVRDGLEDGPVVMCGSHIDTVATGGRFDGNYGVLAGLEAIETIASAGIITKRPLAVAFFTNEEGARFQPDMLGSLVYCGDLASETALDTMDAAGLRLGDELQRIGYDGPWPCPGQAPHRFVELHIEQGPVLDAEGFEIGVVTGVQGISWQEITLRGQSNHAGTTPISHRRDPVLVGAQLTAFARELADRFGAPQVATIGRFDVRPNLINVVGAEVVMTLDLRNTDEALLVAAERQCAEFLTAAANAEGVTWESRVTARFEPVAFDPDMVDLVERTATSMGLSTHRMPSGAGHDAQMMARMCPTSMIFVPSINGLSHNPAELTRPEHLVAGADVLLNVLLELSNE